MLRTYPDHNMVSYYTTPTAVTMFPGTGRGHYHPHHHHSPPGAQGGYFTPGAAAAAAAYSAYGHPHGPHHQSPNTNNTSPLASMGVGVGLGLGPIASTQFSPPGADCNHTHPGSGPGGYSHPHSHQLNSAAVMADSWAAHQSYNSACVARGAAASLGYEDWGGHHMGMAPHPGHTYTHHHPSFYHHAQPSPPSSTPSPHNSQAHLSISAIPSNNVSTTPHSPNNNNYSNTTPNGGSPTFKTEFGPCSGGNQEPQQDLSSSQGGGVGIPTNTNTPHSPDSGMAISDGVSSSGSPATTGGNNNGGLYGNGVGHGPVQCLGGPASSGAGSSASMSSSASSSGEMHLHLQQGSHQYNLTHSHSQHHSHMPSPLLNVGNNGRPTQARSPYEWMKKPAYSSVPTSSSSSSNNAKTRTKDKYRVVYSDTQRLELEKEFHYSRYITIRRKSELAVTLGLSERQVKIWFQNRRAKERKIHRKRDEMMGRDKITMVMQNVMPGMGPNPMCNQSIPLM